MRSYVLEGYHSVNACSASSGKTALGLIMVGATPLNKLHAVCLLVQTYETLPLLTDQ